MSTFLWAMTSQLSQKSKCSFIFHHRRHGNFCCPSLLSFISYPRTETNIFPKSLALGSLVEEQTQSSVWGTFAQRVLEQPGGPNPRQGKKSDQAHPPIHPTRHSSSLQVCLWKWRSFCFIYIFVHLLWLLSVSFYMLLLTDLILNGCKFLK